MPKDGKAIPAFKSKGTNHIIRFMFSDMNALVLIAKTLGNLVVDIEFAPSVNNDIVMPINGRAAARFVSKCTISTTSSGFLALQVNRFLRLLTITFVEAFDLGTLLAGTWLVFASETLPPQNNIHYTNRPLNPDDKSHLFRLLLGPYKCQLRWEDLNILADKDYNDLAVEISIKPN